MAVRLRMAVHGVRNNRVLHIVAVNQRQRRNAKPIELLGVCNPRLKPGETTKTIEWSPQRIQYWLNVGAIPSEAVSKLLRMGGIAPQRAVPDVSVSASRDKSSSPSSESEPTSA